MSEASREIAWVRAHDWLMALRRRKPDSARRAPRFVPVVGFLGEAVAPPGFTRPVWQQLGRDRPCPDCLGGECAMNCGPAGGGE
jgi:hypothetical protein